MTDKKFIQNEFVNDTSPDPANPNGTVLDKAIMDNVSSQYLKVAGLQELDALPETPSSGENIAVLNGDGRAYLHDGAEWRKVLQDTDVPVIARKGAAFLIYATGGAYYAQDGASAEIVSSGADAATVIDAAASALSTAGGGTVRIAPGVYALSTHLDAKSGVRYEGESRGAVTLQDYGMRILGSVSGVEICGITFDNHNSGETDGIFAYSGASDISIHDCKFTGWLFAYQTMMAASGDTVEGISFVGNIVEGGSALYQRGPIYFAGVRGGVIANNIVRTCDGHGIVARNDCRDIVISGNVVDDISRGGNYYAGIVVNTAANPDLRPHNITIAGNTVRLRTDAYYAVGILVRGEEATTDYLYGISITGNTVTDESEEKKFVGIYVHGFSGTGAILNPRGISITGNTVMGSKQGIVATLCRGVTITGNAVIAPTQYGIQLSAGDRCVVSGNVVYNPAAMHRAMDQGIRIGGGLGTHNAITGNVVHDEAGTAAAGIAEAYESGQPTDYNIIEGNVIDGPLAGVVRVGTHSIVKDNIGHATEAGGYGTGTGSKQTIAHGLAVTPTASQVLLSERTTGGAGARQSSAPDATNIYVTAASGKDYNWRVVA